MTFCSTAYKLVSTLLAIQNSRTFRDLSRTSYKISARCSSVFSNCSKNRLSITGLKPAASQYHYQVAAASPYKEATVFEKKIKD